jgi:hypothetical protein
MLHCRYEPNPDLQAPYEPRNVYRSYDCMFPMQQVRCATLACFENKLQAVHLATVLLSLTMTGATTACSQCNNALCSAGMFTGKLAGSTVHVTLLLPLTMTGVCCYP